MSAIFGLIHLDDQPVDPDDLERMARACRPLGPVVGRHVDGAAGLGCRITVVTPQDGEERQPIISADRQTVLMGDIRLDNRNDLAKALDIPAPEASCLPDSAYALYAYEKWGEACIQHLVGDYALAVWHTRDRRLFLARSPIGGRPLYYHASSRRFAFASTPACLFTLPGISRSLNLERLADYLVHAPVEHGTTFFRDIGRLHAGYLATVDRHGVREQRFWQPETVPELRLPRDEDYVDAFTELFEQVVASHLRSVSPIGVMMSGGLDSTAVAAVAATQLMAQGKRLATYTEVPMAGFSGTVLKGRYGDETPYVEAMAREYQNIDLNLIRTGHRSLFDGVEMFFAAANMPFRNAFNRPWIEAILQKARAQGVQVLLTGAQGNLTISRNGAGLIPMLIRGGQWGQALREARAGENGQFLRTLAGQGIFPLLPSPLYRLGQWLRGSRVPLWGPPWSAYSAINPAFARSQRVAERARTKGGDFLFRQHPDMRLTCARMLPGLTMGANDVYHAYLGLHGVEVRDPTADSRIVEFCLSLPEDQYRRDGVSRRLIRRAMTGRLPAEILANRQRGLQAADWFDRLLASRHALLSELAEWSHDDLVSAVLDLKRLVTLVEQLPRAQGDGARIPTDYRLPLEFGLMTGLFIRWCTTGASGNA